MDGSLIRDNVVPKTYHRQSSLPVEPILETPTVITDEEQGSKKSDVLSVEHTKDQRVNSSRFRHSSSIEEPDKGRNVLQRKLSSRVCFSEDVLKAVHRDEELNEENTGEVQKATDELAVANRQEESDDSIVETNNVAVESTIDIESSQEKEVIEKEIDSL